MRVRPSLSSLVIPNWSRISNSRFPSSLKSSNQAEVPELLNTFFIEIGPRLSRNVSNVDTTYKEFLCGTSKEFVFKEITSAHIYSLLSKLCKSKATGLDSISAKLLRECPNLIAESLTLIFNQSLLTGFFSP